MTDGPTGPVLGPRNPESLGDARLGLYPCAGEVIGIQEFAATHIELLAPHERSVVQSALDALPNLQQVPAEASVCLTRSPEIASSTDPVLTCLRSGARSAYLPAQSLKFKGCRPVPDARYPIEVLPFSSTIIQQSQVPFGVLRAEGVMREVLAWCVLRERGLPLHSSPLAVFTYVDRGTPAGHCLVSRTVGETRIEERIAYPDMTVAEVMSAMSKTRATTVGSELPLRGLNLWWYVNEKARQLASLHLAGGFRGVLNSNIGNDVVLEDDDQSCRLLLCDFDTFHLVEVPALWSARFLQDFVRNALVEVIKGSISILYYADLAGCNGVADRGEILSGIYLERSSIWHAYWRELVTRGSRFGIAEGSLRDALVNAVRTDAVVSVLEECILNSHYMAQKATDRGVYYPHN